jgi:pimeloyl-ACP methyl ester carboxylesterase
MTGASRATGSHRAAWIIIALTWLQFGCATPQDRIDAFTTAHGWTTEILAGAGFRHVVVFNGRRGEGLHVYIEGDGSPYLDRWTVSPDPTPRRPVMLGLMALDPAPSVYVGRPCYLGLARDPPCTPADWTVDRYSEPVTASMTLVIEQLRSEHGAASIEVYGHSGGGTLAVLIAHRLQGVVRVVTLAGNLDTDAWARYHGYAPLRGSLNPVRLGKLPASIPQLHLAGSSDQTVPAWLILEAAPLLGGKAEVLPGVTHTAGWNSHWPAVLEATAAPLAPRTGGLP